jgi:hypothetical protein
VAEAPHFKALAISEEATLKSVYIAHTVGSHTSCLNEFIHPFIVFMS